MLTMKRALWLLMPLLLLLLASCGSDEGDQQ